MKPVSGPVKIACPFEPKQSCELDDERTVFKSRMWRERITLVGVNDEQLATGQRSSSLLVWSFGRTNVVGYPSCLCPWGSACIAHAFPLGLRLSSASQSSALSPSQH